MNIIVNRAELLNAARRSAAIIPSSAPLDVLTGVLLESDTAAGKLTLTATNLEISLEQKVSCQTGADDALVVKASLLVGMLERLSGDTVELQRQGDSPRLSVQSGHASYEVSVWEKGSFPKIEIPFPEDTVKLTGIPSMTKRTVFATSEDREKPLLKCVNLMFTQNGLRTAGTNGISVVTAKGDEKSTGNVSLLLPAVSLDKLAHLCTEQDEFRVGTTGKTIVFFKEDFMYSARLMDGTFIDTEYLLSTIRNQFTVLTDVSELRRSLDSVRSIDPDGRVMLAFEDQKLTFLCRGVYGNASNDMDVVPLTGAPEGQYWYDSRQLLASLKALSGTVQMGVAQGGMLTLTTEDASYMQNAMRAPVKKLAAKPATNVAETKRPAEEAAAKKKTSPRKKPAKQAA